ncbi:hypothetical protein CBL_10793 [Carabus blaptoides fortunei]
MDALVRSSPSGRRVHSANTFSDTLRVALLYTCRHVWYVRVCNMIDMGTESRMLCLRTPPTQIVMAQCCADYGCVCMCVPPLLQARRPNPNSAETVSLPRRPQIHYCRGTSAR